MQKCKFKVGQLIQGRYCADGHYGGEGYIKDIRFNKDAGGFEYAVKFDHFDHAIWFFQPKVDAYFKLLHDLKPKFKIGDIIRHTVNKHDTREIFDIKIVGGCDLQYKLDKTSLADLQIPIWCNQDYIELAFELKPREDLGENAGFTKFKLGDYIYNHQGGYRAQVITVSLTSSDRSLKGNYTLRISKENGRTEDIYIDSDKVDPFSSLYDSAKEKWACDCSKQNINSASEKPKFNLGDHIYHTVLGYTATVRGINATANGYVYDLDCAMGVKNPPMWISIDGKSMNLFRILSETPASPENTTTESNPKSAPDKEQIYRMQQVLGRTSDGENCFLSNSHVFYSSGSNHRDALDRHLRNTNILNTGVSLAQYLVVPKNKAGGPDASDWKVLTVRFEKHKVPVIGHPEIKSADIVTFTIDPEDPKNA